MRKSILIALLLAVTSIAFAAEPWPPPELSVSAEELYTHYRNEVAGNQLYRGKILKITGVVDGVRTNSWGDIIVSLGRRYEWVDCSFNAVKAGEIAKLQVGQSVVVIGKCYGLNHPEVFVIGYDIYPL